MSRFALGVATLLAVTAAGPSIAQDELDELLEPLTPSDSARPKKKRRPAPKSPPAAKTPAPKPQADDLVSPLAPPTELVVTLSEPLLGARLFVDGKEVGPVNGLPVEVRPGAHTVVVKRPGFTDFETATTVADGARAQVLVTLQPSGGVLKIHPNVPAADVFIDGELVGKGPIEELVLAPGTYEVRVGKDGYVGESSKLSIRAGHDYTLTPMLSPALAEADRPARKDLTPPAPPATNAATAIGARPELKASPKPWYGQWYVWAGAAAVVAAAAGGTYVAVQNQPGPLTDTEVCGGPCDVVINGPAFRLPVAGAF